MKNNLLLISIIFVFTILFSCGETNNGNGDYHNSSGQGGSMARFVIVDQYLYLVDNNSLIVYNIQNASQPEYIKKIDIGFGIETIFSYKARLFIGSQSGMFIYDVSSPADPAFISEYMHVTSCDPVVVNDSLAFVTLSSGSNCWNQTGVNQLDVINIKNLYNINLIQTYALTEPLGMGLLDHYLFLCDGINGLHLYDFSMPYNLEHVKKITNKHAYDVIIKDTIMFFVGESGLEQYSVANIDSIFRISNIPANFN